MKYIYKIFFIAILFTSFLAHGQNSGIAYYSSHHKMNDFKHETYILKFDRGFSLFTLVQRDTVSRISLNEFQDEITITRKYPDSLIPQYYVNTYSEPNEIISKIPLSNDDYKTFKQYTVTENSNLKWNITKENKYIGNLKCQKAMLYFRGREYTAWFSTDIIIPFGPYKFNNLPGLIISIEDSKGEVKFELIKFELKNITLENIFKELEKNKDKIPLTEFVILQERARKESQENFHSILLSKLGRGASVKITKTENRGIELNYDDADK